LNQYVLASVSKLQTTTRLAALAAALAAMMAACSGANVGAFSGGVGNTPDVPPETTFKILGKVGTPFTATVSNSRSSWVVQGATPMNIVIVNNVLPVRIVATKRSNDTRLISLEVLNGVQIIALSSTSQPFGTASVQTKGTLATLSPAADRDVRIFVRAPFGEAFTGIVEDVSKAFIVQSRVPALFLFDSPEGKVDAEFTQLQDLGLFHVNLTVSGQVVASAIAGPTVDIREP